MIFRDYSPIYWWEETQDNNCRDRESLITGDDEFHGQSGCFPSTIHWRSLLSISAARVNARITCALSRTIYDSFHGSLAKRARPSGCASPSMLEKRTQKKTYHPLRGLFESLHFTSSTGSYTSFKTDLHTLLVRSKFRPSNLTRMTDVSIYNTYSLEKYVFFSFCNPLKYKKR